MPDKYEDYLDSEDAKYSAFLDSEDTPKEKPKVVVASTPQPAPKRSILEELSRQVGLTGRAAVEGITSPFSAAADAMASLYNLGAGAIGSDSRLPLPSKAQSDLLTKYGVPVPETTIERASQVAAQGMVGAGSQAAAAAKIGGAATPLAQNALQQVAAAGTGGFVAQPTAEYVQNVTGSPVAAVAAALAVGQLGGRVGQKAVSGKTPEISIEDIKQRAQRSYTRMEQLDVQAKPQSVLNMVDGVENALTRANFNPVMDSHRPVAQLLDQFRQMTGTQRVPFTRLEQMRSAAVDMSKSNDSQTRRLAGIVVSSIDDYLSHLSPRDLMPGNNRGAEAVKAVQDARKDWKLQARAQTIEDLLDTAALRAENPKASEADLIRNSLTNLAVNPKKMRMFSESEQAAIKEAVRSKNYDPILTLLAKFNPERGGLGAAILSGGVGGSMYTGSWVPSGGSAALTGAGYAADKLYGTLKRKEANKLVSDILTENTQPIPKYEMRGLLSGAAVKPEGNW